MTATKTVKVHVVERNSEFLVWPPIVELEQGDSLEIVNTTAEDLAWAVPAGAFGPDAWAEAVQKRGGKGHTPKQVPPRGGNQSATPGPYEYQIVMLKSGKKAKGNSDPMVIIDP